MSISSSDCMQYFPSGGLLSNKNSINFCLINGGKGLHTFDYTSAMDTSLGKTKTDTIIVKCNHWLILLIAYCDHNLTSQFLSLFIWSKVVIVFYPSTYFCYDIITYEFIVTTPSTIPNLPKRTNVIIIKFLMFTKIKYQAHEPVHNFFFFFFF